MNLPPISTPWGPTKWVVFDGVYIGEDIYIGKVTQYWLSLVPVSEDLNRTYGIALIEEAPTFKFRMQVWAGRHGTESRPFPATFAYYDSIDKTLTAVCDSLNEVNSFSAIERLVAGDMMFTLREQKAQESRGER